MFDTHGKGSTAGQPVRGPPGLCLPVSHTMRTPPLIHVHRGARGVTLLMPASTAIPRRPHGPLLFAAVCLAAFAVLARTAAAAPTPVAPSVTLRPLAEVAIRPERTAPATVVARNESKVAAEVAGRLLSWTRDVGQSVQRGELLAEIDATDHRLNRDRAQAQLDAALARMEWALAAQRRARELVAQGFQSAETVGLRDTEVNALEAEIAAARGAVALAQAQLARARVVAPFAASIRQRFAQAGEWVSPGTPLFLLVELGGAELSAAVPAAEVSSLRNATAVIFESAAAGVSVRLLRVSPTVSAPARTQEARLALPADAPPPGTEGRLRWRDERPHLPAELVVRRQIDGRSQLGVFVVAGGQARFVPLPDAQEGRAALAPAAALPPAARIVVAGQAMLTHGQAVTGTTAPPAAPASAPR